MKLCFVGLGSIGNRHLYNVTRLLSEKGAAYSVDALRSAGGRLAARTEEKLDAQYDSADSLPEDYDIIFVTNPTVCHLDTVRALAGKTRYMFIEKPVFHQYCTDLAGLGLRERQRYYVACPLRFSRTVRYLKKYAAEHRVYSARAISSSYLPDWRPDADYRKVYSADREMGGGVTLDLIHELDYITYLFGMPSEVCNLRGQYSSLELKCDDISLYMLRFEDKLAEIHLDYFGRQTIRQAELFTQEETLRADLLTGTVEHCTKEGCRREELGQEDFYQAEMRYFLEKVVSGQDNMNDIYHANELLRIADETKGAVK